MGSERAVIGMASVMWRAKLCKCHVCITELRIRTRSVRARSAAWWPQAQL